MAKIYYVGDWAVSLGPVFAETPFNYAYKGLDIYYYGRWLKDALESTGQHEVNDVPAWDFYKLMPGEYETILQTYDVTSSATWRPRTSSLSPVSSIAGSSVRRF